MKGKITNQKSVKNQEIKQDMLIFGQLPKIS